MLRLTALLAATALTTASAFAQTAPAPAAAAAPAPALTPAQENAELNAELPADQAALKSHVMFLASDEMRGREAGSPEFNIAAQYVAAQFYAAGLRPAGNDGSYLQKVPLVSYKADGKGTASITRKGGAPVTLEFGKDFVSGVSEAGGEVSVTGQVVFVGYGISAPSLGRDDYKGANVKGKIVAFFGGAPGRFPSEERAHFSSVATKLRMAADHGAIGVIALESPVMNGRSAPFAFLAGNYDRARVTWADPDGRGHVPTPQTPHLGTFSKAGAAKLFEGAKTSWEDVAKLAAQDDPAFQPVVLPVTLTATSKTALTPIASYNVAGLLPGSDPKLKSEVVIYSAHLDHIGVGRPDAKGDTINNGALDNAVGVASLIEEAKRFKASGQPPKRSILFLAVTAEEKGLVGSDYFANNPTLPKASLVADVNLDMPIITYKFNDVIAFGADHSTIGPAVQRAAQGMGMTMTADPMPEESFFVRSDHYRFVQQGIPAVFVWPGMTGPEKDAAQRFLDHNYHRPSDELVQVDPIDWESGVRFVEVNYRIARELADADQRPLWNKGDFFGSYYKGPGAK